MNYSQLDRKIRTKKERQRATTNLIRLRGQLDKSVPPKDMEDNLLLATWNIRDFGKSGRRRLPESWFYIAEIISRFDIVAVQEVNQLPEWQQVMDILGHNSWDFIATDETDRALGGNGERMTFVYDTRKVEFEGIAGEIVLPPKLLISRAELEVGNKRVISGSQFKRTPFIASFHSGWLKFDLCTVHLYYGGSSGTKLQQRIEEISTIAKYLSKRADRALGKDRALIILGDFNIVSPEHKTMKALTDNGFQVPRVLQRNPTTRTKMHYDQIGFKVRPEVMNYIESRAMHPNRRNAGVLPLFERVYSAGQFRKYIHHIKKNTARGKKLRGKSLEEQKKVYRDWKTYQLSDHYPMWVRLQTDDSANYLKRMSAR